MSYSRWGNSTWYTFWTSISPEGFFAKKQQIFEICDFPSYYVTYQAIVDDVDSVIANVKEYYSRPHETSQLSGWDKETGKPIYESDVMEAKNPTDEEMEELKGYMLEFVQDVDQHFKPLTYIRYEWYYPIRNKIVWKYRKLTKNEH